MELSPFLLLFHFLVAIWLLSKRFVASAKPNHTVADRKTNSKIKPTEIKFHTCAQCHSVELDMVNKNHSNITEDMSIT